MGDFYYEQAREHLQKLEDQRQDPSLDQPDEMDKIEVQRWSKFVRKSSAEVLLHFSGSPKPLSESIVEMQYQFIYSLIYVGIIRDVEGVWILNQIAEDMEANRKAEESGR